MPCKCDAYNFPHRFKGGFCDGPKWRCTECGWHGNDLVEHFESGRVGHIDNWMPDEEWEICPECGSEDVEKNT